MSPNAPLPTGPELTEALKPFLDSLHKELNRLKRVIYDLHTRNRYSEARKDTMSDEEILRRNRLIAKLLDLDPQTLSEEGET